MSADKEKAGQRRTDSDLATNLGRLLLGLPESLKEHSAKDRRNFEYHPDVHW